ncbi:hypothetical protein WOLCODRAFT_159405 [Wolfiporia cocos MD-104 SS10]|uniref:Uncharacterized protein n=1 Tax=Wolfiporia cocos (strain MD-104) TaxID=742152 RepID=A0A2H3JR36_WOLCO|nr:hypothetical protein WOLCODRAFT_159405 [Wolfiporia cocos MD-104 SS10]
MSVAIWRASELAFLREQWASEAIRTLLGSTNRYRVAASHVRKAFLQKFGEQPYPAETDDKYQVCLALCKTNRSRKKTPRFEAEMEEQCWERLSSLDQQRIYDWGRNHATSRSVKRLNIAMPRATQIACSGNDPRGKAWTEWASALYETLTEEEKAELQELVWKRHHEMMHTPAEMEAKLGAEEYERARRVAGMETAIRLTMEHWEKQTGWVGTIMMTGLDENGYVTTYTHNTGSNHANQDFEQTLHEEAGLSLGCIRGTLFRFGQDIFNPAPSMQDVPAVGIETLSLLLTDLGVTALMEEEVDRRSLLSTSSPVPSPAALGTEMPEIDAVPPPTVVLAPLETEGATESASLPVSSPELEAAPVLSPTPSQLPTALVMVAQQSHAEPSSGTALVQVEPELASVLSLTSSVTPVEHSAVASSTIPINSPPRLKRKRWPLLSCVIQIGA